VRLQEQWRRERGRYAYETFTHACRRAGETQTLPAWHELNERAQAVWIETAEAVTTRYAGISW